MKKLIAMSFAALAASVASAATVKTATQPWVEAKIADAVKDAGKVQSVNGKTGAVEIAASDVGALPTTGGAVNGAVSVSGADITVIKSPKGEGGEVIAQKVTANTANFKNALYVGGTNSANGVATIAPDGISFGKGKTGINSTQVASPALVGTTLFVGGTNVTSHFTDTDNPHGVTAAQVGARDLLDLAVYAEQTTVTTNEETGVVTTNTATVATQDALATQSSLDKEVSERKSLIKGITTGLNDMSEKLSKKAWRDDVYVKNETYSQTEIDKLVSSATPSDYSNVKSNALSAVQPGDLADVATSGSYDDLYNRPTIPTKVSALSNDSGYITQTTADSTYYQKASGDAWSSYWDGDDVRVTVTNYDSVAHLPSLYLEQRTNDTASASSDTNAFRVVWRELAHWDAFLGSTWNWEDATWQGFDEWRSSLSSALDEKADRAWGFYDSHTGEYAPDGYTSISSSNVMICAGASYQKTATATCDIWVLTADEPYEPTGVSTNGGFQIKDADGNVQFEIVKGDKATVKAQANGVTVDTSTTPNTLVVTYNITATEAPTGEVCLELANAQWKAETDSDCPATVTWSGSSGAWVARITPTASTDKCFFKASYATGGDTYVNNRCAVGMSQIVLGGVTYNLGTATIDGHTVLTLTPAN